MRVIVDAVPTNHPPVANPGFDTTIILPANTINLDGNRSTDPDNNITSYSWTKISVNNIILLAGGYVNGVLSNKVWKLEF